MEISRSETLRPTEESGFERPDQKYLFSYWQVAASLWKARIQKLNPKNEYIIPINWAFHVRPDGYIDFGKMRPEADLKRLSEIFQELDICHSFALGLSPFAHLPNGGIPSNVARMMSTGVDGSSYTILESNGRISHLYSFYDSRVFHAFLTFVRGLNQHFLSEGIKANIYGIDAGHFQDNSFVSYREDHSRAFEAALARFLAMRSGEEICEEVHSKGRNSYQLAQLGEEERQVAEFKGTVYRLYQEACAEELSLFWRGEVKMAYIGGGNRSSLNRLFGQWPKELLAQEVFNSLSQKVIPNFELLTEKEFDSTIHLLANDLVGAGHIQSCLGQGHFHQTNIGNFTPFTLVSLYTDLSGGVPKLGVFRSGGLFSFLDKNYQWSYSIDKVENLKWDEEEEYTQKTIILEGKNVRQENFYQLIKIFMNGGKIVLTSDSLSPYWQKRLNSFVAENNLSRNKVQYHSVEIDLIGLGEGKLILFDTANLIRLRSHQQRFFWDKLIEALNICCVPFQVPDGVSYLWRRRSIGPNELNFEEVRRLNVYNFSSYKRVVTLDLGDGMFMLNVVAHNNVRVHHDRKQVDLSILPGGSLAMDFGVVFQ